MERAAKKDAVEALNGLFKTTSVAVVAHYSGLTVAQMQKLRMQMKQAGASVKVSKNRLAKIALEGTDVVAIGSLALAALPSLDELRAKIVGLLVAPATKIAQLTTAPAAKLARVVQAYASKSEAA